MVEVIFSRQSIADLEHIRDYIAGDSPEDARRFVQRVYERAKDIGRLPGAGRVIPELDDPNAREVFVGNYRIMYLVESTRVRITHIRHGARQDHE